MALKARLSLSHRKRLLLTLLIGTILVPINSTMISVALTPMAHDLHVQISDITWLVTIYLLVMASVQPLSGKTSDILGRKRTFIAGASLFFVASVGCMFSSNLLYLIVFRTIQAVGGAVMTPATSALIRVNFPGERLDKAFGIMSLVMGLGAAIGPMVGAWLISLDLGSWRLLFAINIPFMIVCIALAVFVIPESRGKSTSLDYAGSIFMLLGLSSGVLLITHQLPFTWYWLLAWVVIAAVFYLRERKAKSPLVTFSFFHDIRFTTANLSVLFSNFCMYATLLIMPIFLKTQFNISLNQVGFYMFVFSISMSLSSGLGAPFSRMWSHSGALIVAFASSLTVSLLYFSCLIIWSYHSFLLLAGLFVLGGFAAGIGSVSVQTMSVESVSKADSGSASGIYSTFRYTGSIFSSVLVGLYHSDVAVIFMAMAGVSVLGGLLVLSGYKSCTLLMGTQREQAGA